MNVRIRRYAEATNYAKVLTGVYNGIPKGENGMIIKYQEPAQPINRRDAIRDYRPNIPNRIRRATPAEHIQSMINIYGQSEQPTVTSDAKVLGSINKHMKQLVKDMMIICKQRSMKKVCII